MLKAIAVAVLVTVLSLQFAIAQPTKQPPTQSSQPQSAPQERGTDKSPLIVKIAPIEKSQDDLKRESAQDEAERRLVDLTGDLALYTKLLFGATLALALITIGLVVVGFKQTSDAQRAISAAEKSANATEKNATALINSEAARLFPVINWCNFEKFTADAAHYRASEDMPIGNNAGVRYSLKNYGKTPAIYVENSHAIVISATRPTPVYELSQQIPSNFMIEASGKTEDQMVAVALPIETIKDTFPILEGTSFIWFCGQATYITVFGRRETATFMFRYVKLGGSWRFQADSLEQRDTAN